MRCTPPVCMAWEHLYSSKRTFMFAIGNPETTTLIRSITESIKANRMLIEVAHRDAPNGLADVSSFVCCVPSLPARQIRLLSRERVHSCWKGVRPEHLVTIGFLLQTNERTNEHTNKYPRSMDALFDRDISLPWITRRSATWDTSTCPTAARPRSSPTERARAAWCCTFNQKSFCNLPIVVTSASIDCAPFFLDSAMDARCWPSCYVHLHCS